MSHDSFECNVFAIAPIEMARDHRLTAAQYRVLLALLSYRSKTGDLVWPSRRQLAERTGYTENSISKYTRQLEALGWLKKRGKGGYGRSTRYVITVPNLDDKTLSNPDTVLEEKTLSNPDRVEGKTLSNLETVSNLETLSKLDTQTLSNPATKTLSRLDRGKEQTSEQTKEQTMSERARASVSDVSAELGDVSWRGESGSGGALRTEGLPVSPELAGELVEYRRRHGHPLRTQRALDALARAVDRTARACGMSHEEVLDEMQMASWMSVRPEWIQRRMADPALAVPPGAGAGGRGSQGLTLDDVEGW